MAALNTTERRAVIGFATVFGVLAAIALITAAGGDDPPRKTDTPAQLVGSVPATTSTTAAPTSAAPTTTEPATTAAPTTTTAATTTEAPTTTAAPTTLPPTTAAPTFTVPPTSRTPSVYYANCDDAIAAGAAPIQRGQPGYRSALDRDGDGTACDK